MATIEIEKNRRKMIYDARLKLLFSGYIILTLFIVILLFGKLLGEIGFEFFTPGFSGSEMTLSPGILMLIFVFWTLYGYLLSYSYAMNKVHGLVFRMGHVFEKIADKESSRLTFRRDDPFHPVADSFNRMLEKVGEKPELKKEIQEITRDTHGRIRERLEAVLRKF